MRSRATIVAGQIALIAGAIFVGAEAEPVRLAHLGLSAGSTGSATTQSDRLGSPRPGSDCTPEIFGRIFARTAAAGSCDRRPPGPRGVA
ncbi:hypothetical protein [Enterovirga aerilata]|uniref:Uncharacterized protein n=1 Tax=Enterovirga aerilata TaxID=2730920 RepID=A0A849I608_9HYPH|nr:hypothetical protein [Enterovirga sp. DB1703]NNM73124.1 hypothetical protein [Enterovirga sp. DB1703]